MKESYNLNRKLKLYILISQILFFSTFCLVLSNSNIQIPLKTCGNSSLALNSSGWSKGKVISDDNTN